MEIMKATQGEAQILSDLAFRAKAYWGYNQKFMETCREDLAVRAAEIETNHVYVAKDVGNIVGFYSLQCLQVETELNKFFIDIGTIRKGIGKRLWEHMRKTARQMHVERVSSIAIRMRKVFTARWEQNELVSCHQAFFQTENFRSWNMSSKMGSTKEIEKKNNL